MEAINFKIIVLGAQGVGKSSLINRYVKGEFSDNYNVTVGVQFSTKIMKIDSTCFVRLQIWDTAGQQLFRALVRSFYKGIVAVFFVFAVDRIQSLKQLQAWVEEVQENADQQVLFFLIGSRADIEANRQVTTQQAAQFLRRIKGVYLIETSAKTGSNIGILFEKAADILYKKFKTNPTFAKIVQPFQIQNKRGQRQTRGQSIVLRRSTLNNNKNEGKQRKKCCQ